MLVSSKLAAQTDQTKSMHIAGCVLHMHAAYLFNINKYKARTEKEPQPKLESVYT